MTDTETVEQITLTDEQLAALTELSLADATTYPILMHATWVAILGQERWDETETLRPQAFAIPTSQWHTICQLFIELGKRKSEDRRQCGLETVNYGLDFMNIGPSSF